ncbi:hypothetical protein ABKN59_009300 [Abortiporus biennis]
MLSEEDVIPHRIRHITAIQIRNLTPFPVRDAFASALKQPSEQSQFTTHGRLSDDLDISFGKRRGRRVSSASVNSIRPTVLNGDTQSNEPRQEQVSVGRRWSNASRGSSNGNGKLRRGSVSGTHPSRPTRPRTISTTSSTGSRRRSLSPPHSSLRNLLHDTSQTSLENILRFRLVETYITVSASQSSDPIAVGPSKSKRRTPSSPHNRIDLAETSSGGSSKNGSPDVRTPVENGQPHLRGLASRLNGTAGHSKSLSLSPQELTAKLKSHKRGLSAQPLLQSPPTSSGVPIYKSPVHRPSTNPTFTVDPRHDFHLSPLDVTGSKLRVEVWAKLPYELTQAREKGKGKMKEIDEIPDTNSDWKVLDHWDLDLSDLVPLPSDLATSQLPGNTLVLTLSPPGRPFYLSPLKQENRRGPSPQMSEATNTGYNSDPETETWKAKELSSPLLLPSISVESQVSSTASQGDSASMRKRNQFKRSATWQNLLRLVNLQAVVLDTEKSLSDIVSDIDYLVVQNTISVSNREVSERKATVRQLEAEKGFVEDEAQNLTNQIDSRREALRRRRQLLAEAKKADQEEGQAIADLSLEIDHERESVRELRSSFSPVRSSLLSVLSSIYPIELLSPPDLLFTILDVPLPIPLASNDPAPPLSVPKFGVTEEVVATALGYAAQVVQMLAGYMNISLTYPITCVGSRSLIKDGISAMVGPRMFPLFSKGVDTYRFEYGVFLLNKDIELLMTDRDLRAMDMRHTLPNLKNLLLTLTDPDTTPTTMRPPSIVSSNSTSLLRSPAASASILDDTATVKDVKTKSETDETTAITTGEQDALSSGSRTPTATTSNSGGTRRSRAFLDLSPFAGFLRVSFADRGTILLSFSFSPAYFHSRPTPQCTTICPFLDGLKSSGRISLVQL